MPMKRHLSAVLLASAWFASPLTYALDAPKGRTIVTLSGAISDKNVGDTAQLDAAMLDRLPQVKMTVPTPWSKTPQTFEGPLLRDVLKLVGAQGRTLKVLALNDYAAEIPMQDLVQYDVVLARKVDGKVLTVRDKGPLFVMYPFHKHPALQTKAFYSRCVWQVNRIQVH
jgi:hypothetical protein